jgi:hypothetical protein
MKSETKNGRVGSDAGGSAAASGCSVGCGRFLGVASGGAGRCVLGAAGCARTARACCSVGVESQGMDAGAPGAVAAWPGPVGLALARGWMRALGAAGACARRGGERAARE